MSDLPAEVDVLVVGAGQAGLAAGHELCRRGIEAHIVDGAPRIGQSWRSRWDSLRLFTPAASNGLPGMPMTGTERYPTKDEAADFLERYAETNDLPVGLDSPATHVERCADGFIVRVAGHPVRATAIIAATGAHRLPRIPDLAADLDPAITQLASLDYRRPDALPAGPVLVVGAANSGAEIAMDLVLAGRSVVLAGRDVGRIPQLGAPVFGLMRRIRTTGGPGRFIARAALGAGGDPLGRIDPRDLLGVGIRRVGRIIGAVDGDPATVDGSLTGLGSIVWCTGSRPDLRWLRPAVPDAAHCVPQHRAGVLQHVPGVFLLGQPYQRTMASHLMGGVGADATALAHQMADRHRNPNLSRPRRSR